MGNLATERIKPSGPCTHTAIYYMWPKVIIYDLPSKVEKEELLDAVEEHLNCDLPENWCALARKIINLSKKDVSNWILKIHLLAWKKMTSGDRLYVGWQTYKLEKFVKLTRCFKCQRFGHVAKNCLSKKSCGVCTSSNHQTRDCPYKNSKEKHRCMNCIRAKFRTIGHAATDTECPIFLSRLEEYVEKIDYNCCI